MGYLGDGLTFNELRHANVRRCNEDFRNCKEWSTADWMTALVGEIGELANVLKKIRRQDYTLEEARRMVEDELGDVQTYLDLLAADLGVNLGRATMRKFNEVSERIGSPIYFGPDSEWHYKKEPHHADED